MNKQFSISLVFILFCSILFAQSNLNSYKYILVPKQFEFQKSGDQYQLNSLTKFLFERAGFSVFLTDEQYPSDLVYNNCRTLKVMINNSSGFLKTKVTIELYDCYNKRVYITKEGISKDKDYKVAYQEAIRNAFGDLEALNYVYDNTEASNSIIKVEVLEDVAVPVIITTPKIEEVVVIEEVVAVTPINEKVLEPAPKLVKETIAKEIKVVPSKIMEKPLVVTIEGKFNFDSWGISTISKNDDDYSVVGGDENFEFATIYKTSNPTLFIIKWVAFKQPQLLEITSDGNLKVDTGSAVKVYMRVE